MSFDDYVCVIPLDELKINLIYDYKEPTITYNNTPGYYLKSKPVDKSYFENLKDDDFTQSKVGKGNNNIINTTVRSSKIQKISNISISEHIIRLSDIKKIKPLKQSLECKYSYRFDLLKYEIGDLLLNNKDFHYFYTPHFQSCCNSGCIVMKYEIVNFEIQKL